MVERPLRILALDLGAESGRALVGAFDGSRLSLEMPHRFANVPVRLGGTLYWDFPRLFGDVLDGVRAALQQGPLASLGVDSWGVDFGLLDRRGRLLGNPVHYRDARTEGMLERADHLVSRERIYAETGIQLMPINTLYQLLAMVEADDPDLQRADQLLMIPDLIHHFLCDSQVGEYTNASTTQCLDMAHGTWATDLLSDLNIPARLFPDVVQPGTPLGKLRADVASEVGARLTVVAPATHDTASAVAGTPLDASGRTAFLSSGTWSLVGVELPGPVIAEQARRDNLTNEGGVNGTVRLLKNVMGLWLVQGARRALGASTSYAELTEQAAAAPAFSAFIDPDDERFLRPGDLPTNVRAFCAETGQTPPADAASLVRVLLESLALKYAVVLRQVEAVGGHALEAIHVVGGGSNNVMLCQLTADASGLPVLAGPVEATSIGNLVLQAIALGELASIADARAMVAASFAPRRYEPEGDWSEPRQRFAELLRSRSQAEGVQQVQ
jgi:rhamnulokinase